MQGSDADAARSDALDGVRAQFHRELMRKSMRIAELELELQELRREVESSLSWRLTRPFRVRSRIRRLRADSGEPG